MAATDRIRGFVGQGMNGQRKLPPTYVASYTQGTFTWTAPATGTFRFVLLGAGASGSSTGPWGGGSGAFYQAERSIAKGRTASIVVGVGGAGNNGAGTDGAATVVTLPGGEVLTAGGGVTVASTAGGTATANTPADIVYAGSAGGTGAAAGTNGLGGNGGTGGGSTNGGGGAPGYGTHRGGDGQGAGSSNPASGGPGGGGTTTSGNISTPGGAGLVLIYRVKMTA